jgi:hypothetical protein
MEVIVLVKILVIENNEVAPSGSIGRALKEFGAELTILRLLSGEKMGLEPLTDKLKSLVTTLELVRIEKMVRVPKYWKGQSPKNRKQI